MAEGGAGPEGRGRRLDGWKLIAAHFGRDRATVIRWAGSRSLPVHKVPGSPTGSVFAFTGELDAWLAARNPAGDLAATPAATIAGPNGAEEGFAALGKKRRWFLVGGLAGAVTLGGAGLLMWRSGGFAARGPSLPRDPAAARLYVEARQALDQRSERSIRTAFELFNRVLQIEPHFAPAHAGIAETWLLQREFGTASDAQAYSAAEQAARAAIARDPNQLEANRALGFVAYWWKGDRAATVEAFGRALRRDPDNWQTLFWLGNILADNGEFAAGLAALDKARLLNPGQPAVAVDHALAVWSAGRRAEAHQLLDVLAARPEPPAGVYLIRRVTRMFEKDVAAAIEASQALFVARAYQPGLDQTDEDRRAFAAGGSDRYFDLQVSRARSALDGLPEPDLAWLAGMLALRGERAPLLEALQQADRIGRPFGLQGYLTCAFEPWQTDREITDLAGRRRPPPLGIAITSR